MTQIQFDLRSEVREHKVCATNYLSLRTV